MNQQTMPNITLFDLLARSWQNQTGIDRICFNGDGTLLAIASADGALALARLADNEPPESRIAVDDGQMTMRPRVGRPSPLIKTGINAAQGLAAAGESEILALGEDGALVLLDGSAEIVAKILADKSPISTFDHSSRTGLTAVVAQGLLRLQAADTSSVSEIALDGDEVEILAISQRGDHVASAGIGGLVVRSIAALGEPLHRAALTDRPLSLQWSADDRWLACGLLSGGFCLLEIASGRAVMLPDFPTPVASLAWSPSTNAIFASGAYRIAGWSMDTPPLSDNATGALGAGPAGFVIVNSVAAHPEKPLMAAGYANGRITVAGIGTPDELVVRGAGGPVTALQWSADGRYLAVGDALGNISIITFPDQIFK